MISHNNNHGATDRIAVIDVNCEILPRAVAVLMDAGFSILGSLRSSPYHAGIIRLQIRGSALPEECSGAMHRVRVTFEVESYGDQKLTRIRDVQLDGPALTRSELV